MKWLLIIVLSLVGRQGVIRSGNAVATLGQGAVDQAAQRVKGVAGTTLRKTAATNVDVSAKRLNEALQGAKDEGTKALNTSADQMQKRGTKAVQNATQQVVKTGTTALDNSLSQLRKVNPSFTPGTLGSRSCTLEELLGASHGGRPGCVERCRPADPPGHRRGGRQDQPGGDARGCRPRSGAGRSTAGASPPRADAAARARWRNAPGRPCPE